MKPMDVMRQLKQVVNIFRVINAINFTVGHVGYAASYFPEYAKARLAAGIEIDLLKSLLGIIFKMLAEKPKIDSFMLGGKKIVCFSDFSKIFLGHLGTCLFQEYPIFLSGTSGNNGFERVGFDSRTRKNFGIGRAEWVR